MAPAVAFDHAVLTSCKSNIQRLCAEVQTGGSRILQCLTDHKEAMGVGCAQGFAKLKKGTAK